MDGGRRRFLRLTAAAAATGLSARPSSAAAPATIRLLVGFPEGGPLDIVARLIAPRLASSLSVDVRVDNLVGTSGNVATLAAARSDPDGRTLILVGPVAAINATLFPRFPVDITRDLTAIARIASVPLIVEVGSAVPVRSVPELLALARSRPGRLRVAFAGIGTPQHIAIAQFERMAGVTVTRLAEPGSAAALALLRRGDADAMFDPAPSSLPLIRAGRLVPLATTGRTRAPALPDLPTLAEHLPGYDAGSWFGLCAPRGVPRPAVRRLNAAVAAALTEPSFRAALDDIGATALPGSPDGFAAFIAAEIARYRESIRALGIEPG